MAVVAAVAVAASVDLLPSFGNPFGQREIDRSQPSVLEAIEDLSEYKAATGNFSEIIDVEEDTRFLPAWLSGERTVFVVGGTVDASVDFSTLDDRAIVVSPDGESVTVTLPEAVLSEPRIDPDMTEVVDRDRGLLDRAAGAFADPGDDSGLYRLAEDKLAAAALDSNLRSRAESNTRDMLQGMLGQLGYENVRVVFQAPVAATRS